MLFREIIKYANMVEDCRYGKGRSLHDKRVATGKALINEIQKTGMSNQLRTVEEHMMFYCILGEYSEIVDRCTSADIFKLKVEVDIAAHSMVEQILSNQPKRKITEEDVNGFLTKSKDHSAKFKLVVTRTGDGSDCSHYQIRSLVAPIDISDEVLIKHNFPDYEEFLTDEDRDPADISTRDVTVREIRFGKVLSRVKVIHEPKFVIEKV